MPLTARSLLLVALPLLAGCDDVVLFDVSGTRLLVAADASGQTPLVADAKKPRHLYWVESTTGEVERVTQRPRKLSWPRACGEGVLFVEGRKNLVHIEGAKQTTLYRGDRPLFQPTPSPKGDAVLVIEAPRLGVPGRLKVLGLPGGVLRRTVDDVVLGAAWTPDGGILVPQAKGNRTKPFASGPGRILHIGANGEERTLFSGSLPAITVLSPAARQQILATLHLDGEEGPLGLALLSAERRGAQRGPRGVFDFWPAVSADKRQVLFTRSAGEDPKIEGELRAAPTLRPADSRVIPTPTAVAAPRWVGADRVAFITADHHLIVQGLDGSNRTDMTERLRTAFTAEEHQ